MWLFVFFCAFVVIVIVCESLVLGCWKGGADGIVPAGGEPGRAPARQSRTKIDREVPPLFLIPRPPSPRLRRERSPRSSALTSIPPPQVSSLYKKAKVLSPSRIKSPSSPILMQNQAMKPAQQLPAYPAFPIPPYPPTLGLFTPSSWRPCIECKGLFLPPLCLDHNTLSHPL